MVAFAKSWRREGRSLIIAQIAAPVLGHNHRLFKKYTLRQIDNWTFLKPCWARLRRCVQQGCRS
jgi:hypothetical protein